MVFIHEEFMTRNPDSNNTGAFIYLRLVHAFFAQIFMPTAVRPLLCQLTMTRLGPSSCIAFTFIQGTVTRLWLLSSIRYN